MALIRRMKFITGSVLKCSNQRHRYSRISERILDRHHPASRRDALRLLSWIICAIRPLRWREIQGAVAINAEEDDVDVAKEGWKDDHTGLCGPFVELHTNGTLGMVHSTAISYVSDIRLVVFMSELTAISYLVNSGLVKERLEHAKLATTCVEYLCLSAFEIDLAADERDNNILRGTYAFLDYAFIQWPRHIERALQSNDQVQSNDPAELKDALDHAAETLEVFFDLHWKDPGKKSKVPKRMISCVQNWRHVHLREKLLQSMASQWSFTSQEVPEMESFTTLDLYEAVPQIRTRLEELANQSAHAPAIEEYYGGFPFKCPRLYCDWFHEGLRAVEDRKLHVQKHERPYRCTYIGCYHAKMGCSTATELDAHIAAYHSGKPKEDEFPATEQKPLKVGRGTIHCDQCPKKFTTGSNLRAHLRTHTGERRFGCSICGKRFACKHDCDTHERQHSKKKEKKRKIITCEGALHSGAKWGCGKSFTNGKALARHFGSQTGRSCIRLLQEQEMAKRREVEQPRSSLSATASIAPLADAIKRDVGGSDVLPPVLLEQFPAPDGIDIQAACEWLQSDEDGVVEENFDAHLGNAYGEDSSFFGDSMDGVICAVPRKPIA